MNHTNNMQHSSASGIGPRVTVSGSGVTLDGQGMTVQDVVVAHQVLQNSVQHLQEGQHSSMEDLIQNMGSEQRQEQPKVVLVTMPEGIGGSGEGDVEIIVTTHLSPTDDDSMYVVHNNETQYQQLENAAVANMDLPQTVTDYNVSLINPQSGHQTVQTSHGVSMDTTGHHTMLMDSTGHGTVHIDTGHGTVHLDSSSQTSYQQPGSAAHIQTFQPVNTSGNAIYNSAVSSGIIPSTQTSTPDEYSTTVTSGTQSTPFHSSVNSLPGQQMISLSRFPVTAEQGVSAAPQQFASMAESGQETSVASSAGVQAPDVNFMTPEARELYEKLETMKSLELVEAQWKSAVAEASPKSGNGVMFPEEEVESESGVFAYEVVDIKVEHEHEDENESSSPKKDAVKQAEDRAAGCASIGGTYSERLQVKTEGDIVSQKSFSVKEINASPANVVKKSTKSLTCIEHGMSFSDDHSLKTHEINHSSSLTCETCHKTFNSVAYLKSHMRTHTGEKLHVCDICDESFTSSNMLRGHKLKYHKEVIETCDLCNKEFVSVELLDKHMQEHITSKLSGQRQKGQRGRKSKPKMAKKTTKMTTAQLKVKMPVAGTRPQTRGLKKKLAEEKAGNLSRQKQDPPKQSVFTCIICLEKFKSKILLKKHGRRHLGQRILRCDKCGKVFQDSIKLKMHKLTHKGESVSCEFCGRTFSYASTLAIHKKTHRNEKGFQCRSCGKKFATADMLKTHKATHTPNKAFVCDVCEKAFTSQYYLKAHKRLHTGEKHYGCLQCGESFMFSTGLRRHVIKTHGGSAGKKRSSTAVNTESVDAGLSGDNNEGVEVDNDDRTEIDNDDPDFDPLSISQEEEFGSDNMKMTFDKNVVLELKRDEDGVLECQCCGKKFQSTPALNTHMKEHVKFPHTCQICKKTFSRKLYLQKHIQRHNDDRPFPCKVCGKKFRSATYLEQHEQIHTGEKSYECQLCGLEFIFANSLRRHLKTHDEIGSNMQGLVRKKKKGKNYRPVSEFSPDKISQLTCSLCGNTFQTLPQFEEHMKSHSGENPVYECSVCKKEFTSHRALWRHRQSHVDDQPITCEVCHKSFRSSYYLKSHMNLHSGKKPYKCKSCDMTFAYASTRRRHMRTHIPEESMNFMCSICGKKFFEQGEFDRHIAAHTGEKAFMCDVCGKTFATKALLRSHMNRHNGERQYKCQICNKTFLYRYRLHRHIKTHNAVKSFLCNVCGKGFLTQTYLSTHLRFHTGEKPYKCEVCGDEFSFSNTFRRHKRIHTGQTLNCGVCGKMCLELFDLKRHMQSHSDQKTVMCDICGKTFSHQGSCKRHMRRIHPENVMPFQVSENINVEIHVA